MDTVYDWGSLKVLIIPVPGMLRSRLRLAVIKEKQLARQLELEEQLRQQEDDC